MKSTSCARGLEVEAAITLSPTRRNAFGVCGILGLQALMYKISLVCCQSFSGGVKSK